MCEKQSKALEALSLIQAGESFDKVSKDGTFRWLDFSRGMPSVRPSIFKTGWYDSLFFPLPRWPEK